MGYDFNGKTVLITGGSSGIGLATAEKLAEKGANLWLLARRLEPLEKAKELLITKRVNPNQFIEIATMDVSNPEQVKQTIGSIIHQAGVPDILINSAGITYPGYLDKLDLEIIQQLMEINYLGTVNTTMAVLTGMLARGSGSIVNISSMAAIISLPGYSAYGASKFAVRGFSESLRSEVKRKGIHIAVVYPPDTDTPQLKNELPLRPSEVNMIASLDSVMEAEEVADHIIKGISKQKFMIIPGAGNQFFYWLASLTGTFSYTILDILVNWAIKKTKNLESGPK